jgi:polyisoprenoid-binding protein YceI
MKTIKLLALAAVLALSPACKKTEKAKPDPAAGSAATGSAEGSAPGSAEGSAPGSAAAGSAEGSAAAGSAEGSAAAAMPPADDTADYIKVLAVHHEPKPGDPVEVKFERFKITKANFDPAKIEGGTATIELDVTSLKSGSDQRDGHLQSPDYIDTAKFATATIDIGNVKKQDDKRFTADAKIKFRGVEKKYPVAFEVVEAKDDWIRVRGEHKFQRMDFKVGRPAGPDPKAPTDPKKAEGVGAELTAKIQLTLKKV